MHDTDRAVDELAKRYARRGTRLHRWLRPPVPLVHDRGEAQLPVTEGPRLLIGGAGAPRRAGFLTVDLVATRDVDLVSNVEQLAIRDGSVGAIECDAVLEHVSDPRSSVDEFHRVLRSGGWLHVVVPFNHPFHAYPRDFQRWTIDGLTRLLERFEVVETGVRTSPTATLLTFALDTPKWSRAARSSVRVLPPSAGSCGRCAASIAGSIAGPTRTCSPTASTRWCGNVERSRPSAVPRQVVVRHSGDHSAARRRMPVLRPAAIAVNGRGAEANRLAGAGTDRDAVRRRRRTEVAGVSSFDRYPPEVETRPRVGALVDPDLERILALRPDLVLTYASQDDLKRQLERAGIPIFDYRHGGLADVTTTIVVLGDRVGHGAEGRRVTAEIDRQIEAIRTRVVKRPRPRVLLVFGRDPDSLRNIYASGGVGFLNDMLIAAGGDNVLSDIRRESAQITTELVLARSPDVILEIRSADSPGSVAAEADMSAWRTLAAIPAVRANRLLLLRDDALVVPGPRVGRGVERLAQALHPDAFPP